jgi:ssDNA-binding Zn-finger/Zn-ribbon topoisomerase 1
MLTLCNKCREVYNAKSREEMEKQICPECDPSREILVIKISSTKTVTKKMIRLLKEAIANAKDKRGHWM